MSSSSPRQIHVRGIQSMVLSALCFTANALIIRVLGSVQEVDVWLLASVRFLVGLVLIVSIFRVGPESFQPRNLYRHRRLISRGLVGAGGVYCYYLSVVHLGPGRATFINNTYVAMGALFAVVMLHEPLRRTLVLGAVASLGGLALITNVFNAGSGMQLYDIAAIGSALGSAYVVVTIRQLHAEGEHTSTIFAAQCAYGLVLSTGPAIVTWAPHGALAWTLMLVAAVCSGSGQILMTRAFRDLPVGEGSLLQMLVPLGIAIGGAVFFHEHFLPHEIIGAALILAGSALPTFRRA